MPMSNVNILACLVRIIWVKEQHAQAPHWLRQSCMPGSALPHESSEDGGAQTSCQPSLCAVNTANLSALSLPMRAKRPVRPHLIISSKPNCASYYCFCASASTWGGGLRFLQRLCAAVLDCVVVPLCTLRMAGDPSILQLNEDTARLEH